VKPLLSGRARRIRFEAIESLVAGDVLDIGCGVSPLTGMVPGLTSYVGIDINEQAIAYCREHYQEYEFHCLNLDADVLPSFQRQFDTVTMTAVIEHLHDPERALRVLRPLLKEGGRLLVTTPTPLGDLAHQIGSRIGLFYSEAKVQHVKIFSKGQLCGLLVECGYEIERYRRFSLGLNQLVVGRPASDRQTGNQT
jgi:2-polyprenyl-3-methyl-5-hydroxy-6-metoxy-1,4-benzoquinol methylase